ncbi:hypothetical protein C8R44DRAFT_726763 [Mycena epipterygia]|nr:hypothetical protein C8R44DRAFT_726763 [Mycena epipterygia]
MAILPPEIYALIWDEVEELSNLAILCRTSRLFRDRAQHILYHRVNLRGRVLRSVLLWCVAVARHSYLAERVHALSLSLLANLDPTDATKIHCALNRCVNLKELNISGQGLRPDCVQSWMISRCPFRLTKFTNSYFVCDGLAMEGFWDAQSEIRVLSLPDHPLTHFPCSDEQLPNLIAIGVATFAGLPARRLLQRLETGFPSNLNFSSLAQYSQTLTTLNLLRKSIYPNPSVTISKTLESIAGLLSALVHLGVVEAIWKPNSAQMEPTPTEALRKFPRLETFILHVRTVTRFKDPNSELIYEMDVAADLEALGLDIMVACLRLRRTDMGAEVVLDEELSCVLTRSPGGGVHSEAGTDLNFNAVSMFWDP